MKTAFKRSTVMQTISIILVSSVKFCVYIINKACVPKIMLLYSMFIAVGKPFEFEI